MFVKTAVLTLIILNFSTINALAQEGTDEIGVQEDIKSIDTPDKATQTDQPKNIPLTEEEIIGLVTEKHKGTFLGNFMDSNPRLTKLTVRITLNENIKKLWRDTLLNKTRYYIFAAFFILTMVINWAWKRNQIRSEMSFWKGVLGFFKRIFVVNISRVLAFLYLFSVEVAPIWLVFKKTFEF